MSETIQIEQSNQTLGKALRLKYSADGTNYDIIAILMPEGISCGYMCNGKAILVISGYDKTAYSFGLDSYISWDYVCEKLVRNYNHCDAKNLTVLIRKAQEIFKAEEST